MGERKGLVLPGRGQSDHTTGQNEVRREYSCIGYGADTSGQVEVMIRLVERRQMRCTQLLVRLACWPKAQSGSICRVR